jgi:hypothetical protein
MSEAPADQRTTQPIAQSGQGRRAREDAWAWVDRNSAAILLLVLLFALALGVVKLWIDRPSFDYNWENRWWQIALNVARGEGYVACKPLYFPFCGPTNQVTAMREPLPVLLFALVARLTNASLMAAAATGVPSNLGVIVGLFLLGRELAHPRAGLAAAGLWALYLAPIRLFYSQVSGDLPATLGITWALFFVVRARRRGTARDWIAAGLCLGLATLSRSAVLVITLALAAGLLMWPRAGSTPQLAGRSPREGVGFYGRLRPALLLGLAWAVTIAPWFVRNYAVFGRPVLGSTLSGYYLLRQNHILPSADYLRFVSGGEFEPVLNAMLAARPGVRGNENEAQMDAIYRAEALKVIRAYPLRYAALSAYRFLMLWFNWGVREVYGLQDNLSDRVIGLQQIFFLLMGIVGSWRYWSRAWPLALSVSAFTGLYMAVMAHLPYIVPVMPLVVMLSALALTGWTQPAAAAEQPG